MPGKCSVSRLIEWQDRNIQSAGGSPSALLDVAPAATVKLTLGGTGRPVVGKAALPAELAGRDDWLFDFSYLVRKPPSQGHSGAGEAGPVRRADTSITFKTEHDGSFRIDDVEAGTYDLLITVSKRPTDQGGRGHEVLATTRHEVIVPAMPGGRSDEPLDLGVIILTAEKKPERPPAEPQP